MANTFIITCCGKTNTYPESLQKMTKEFKMDMFCCDGSQARYIVYLSRFDSWREGVYGYRSLVDS